MDSELKAIVRASDDALNGSEWVQYFCHPTKLYKSFVKFYYEHVATEEISIGPYVLSGGEPAAMAIVFFSAPPSSTPTTSWLV